jgi:hypothetical protein
MYLKKVISKNFFLKLFFVGVLKANDENVMDPQHCNKQFISVLLKGYNESLPLKKTNRLLKFGYNLSKIYDFLVYLKSKIFMFCNPS